VVVVLNLDLLMVVVGEVVVVPLGLRQDLHPQVL
jgi:hypothetical protein